MHHATCMIVNRLSERSTHKYTNVWNYMCLHNGNWGCEFERANYEYPHTWGCEEVKSNIERRRKIELEK